MSGEDDGSRPGKTARNPCRGNVYYWLIIPLATFTILRAVVNERSLGSLQFVGSSSGTGSIQFRGRYARPSPVFDPSTVLTPKQLRARRQAWVALLKQVPANIT